MLTPAQPLRYLSYLLRYWEEREPKPGQPAMWRFSLEDVETGERRGFANLEALVAFLQAKMAPEPPEAEPHATEEPSPNDPR